MRTCRTHAAPSLLDGRAEGRRGHSSLQVAEHNLPGSEEPVTDTLDRQPATLRLGMRT